MLLKNKIYLKLKRLYTKSIAIGEKDSKDKMLLHPTDNIKRYEVTGGQCVALGIDAKFIPTGKCKRGDVTKETKDYITTPLNIDKPIGNSCIFNRGGECFYDGECKDKFNKDD